MTSFHRILGTVIVVLFVVLVVAGIGLRLTGTRDTPRLVWITQRWTENLLAVQLVVGLVLLIMGRRPTGTGLIWFHYLYGALFPFIAVVAGRLAGLRRGEREYVGLAWGAFVAFGLTLRAVQTGCGLDVSLASCFGF